MNQSEIPQHHPIENYREYFSKIYPGFPTLASIDPLIRSKNYPVKINAGYPNTVNHSCLIYDYQDKDNRTRQVLIYDSPNSRQTYLFDKNGCTKVTTFVKTSENNSMSETINLDPVHKEVVSYRRDYTYPGGSSTEIVNLSVLNRKHTLTYKDQLGNKIKEETFNL